MVNEISQQIQKIKEKLVNKPTTSVTVFIPIKKDDKYIHTSIKGNKDSHKRTMYRHGTTSYAYTNNREDTLN